MIKAKRPGLNCTKLSYDAISAPCSFKVGASVDPAGVTMLDSIKIYGKTKEQFGWPEDPPEDFSSASVNNVCSPNLSQSNGTSDGDIVTPTATSGSVIERFVLHYAQFT